MKRFVPYLSWLVALLLIAFVLLRFENDLLWKVQQYNLFLDTPLFFREQMVVSGGFLSYISCYFTQFFYHPWLGVLILCAWWLLLMWLVKRTFHIADQWAVVTLIPVALLLIANMDLGYWHYFMRLRGYFFVATIGTTVGVAMLWAFRALPEKLWIRIVYIVVAIVVGYPLFGIYALAAVLLMAIWTWRLSNDRKKNIILTIVALLSIVAVPLVYYRLVYYQTYLSDIWTTALPSFTAVDTFSSYYIPYYILALFFLVMVIGVTPRSAQPLRLAKNPSMKREEGSKKQSKNQKKQSLIQWGLQGLMVVVLVIVVYHYWYKDENFHHELVMQHCIEKADWEGVLNEGKTQAAEPTRSIVMMRNLALSRLDRIDEVFDYPDGKKSGNTVVPFDMLNKVFSKTIYYQYGLLNDSHRRCMEDAVEYGWSVETLQYMARCSILSGERRAARKVLNKLRHTMYYSEWADSIQPLMDDLSKRADDPEMGPITRMLQYKNALGMDEGNVEKYLMNVLAYQDSQGAYFQEQSVLAALLKRNPQLFWPRFKRYVYLLQGTKPIPRIFQEAAIFFGSIENNPAITSIPFDKGVVEKYASFVKESQKYRGQQASVGRAALYPFFGNTYYYYFYFMQDTK